MRLNPKDVIDLRSNKRRIWKNILDLEINHEPDAYPRDFIESKPHIFRRIDHTMYVRDNYLGILNLYFTGFFIFLGVVSLFVDDGEIKPIIFCSICILIGVLFWLINFLSRHKSKLIMDREQGLISYPDVFYKKQIVTEFNNLCVILGGTGSYGRLILKIRRPSLFSYYHVHSLSPLNYWSFMVWYMDKNRPLPPGDAFDAYRQEDYERRKSEGFPPPLYSSFIPTPEATPEQQAEREQYWKERIVREGNEIKRYLWLCEEHS